MLKVKQQWSLPGIFVKITTVVLERCVRRKLKEAIGFLKHTECGFRKDKEGELEI